MTGHSATPMTPSSARSATDNKFLDRLYLNCYVPGLQYDRGLVAYVHRQVGLPIASTAPIAKISKTFDAAVHQFAIDEDIPWVNFIKSQRKDDVTHESLTRFEAAGRREGVLLIGRAAVGLLMWSRMPVNVRPYSLTATGTTRKVEL